MEYFLWAPRPSHPGPGRDAAECHPLQRTIPRHPIPRAWNRGWQGPVLLILFLACLLVLSRSGRAQTDSSLVYDPFGPEGTASHTGAGSGGVITPSPYDDLAQSYYTLISSDYYGIQYMLDSPLQIAAGGAWADNHIDGWGGLLKVRCSGKRLTEYDPLRLQDVPYYLFAFEAAADYTFRDREIRAAKARVHLHTEARGLSMSGVGMIVSSWNLLLGLERAMDRRFEAELTWVQASGGYVMPLSPRTCGVNLSLCLTAELFGARYQTYYSDIGEYAAFKVSTIGFVLGAGMNAGKIMNLALYAGGDWGLSIGGLIERKTVFALQRRPTLFLATQAIGRTLNVTGGVQWEWERLDYQGISKYDVVVRAYAGLSIYCWR